MNQLTTQEKKQKLEIYKASFEAQKENLMRALPSHINPERFIRICINALTNTPKLFECSRESFFLSVMRAASLGLEPDGLLGQAYLIPYGKQAQLIIGYKGLLVLARNSGEISKIGAYVVHENDDLCIDAFGESRFIPNLTGERGKIVGYLGVAKFKGHDEYASEFMTVEEVNRIRDNSQGWKQALKDAKRDKDGKIEKFINRFGKEVESVPWFHHYDEMAKKTVIRRLAKQLPLSVQRAAQLEDLQEKGYTFDVLPGGDIEIQEPPQDDPNDGDYIDLAPASEAAEAHKESQPAKDWEAVIADIQSVKDMTLLHRIKASLTDDTPRAVYDALDAKADELDPPKKEK